MNRGYTIKEFTYLVHHFRKAIPTLTLSTDVIIGFPTETDEQFDHTIELLKEIRPDIINITRFSARPLTTCEKNERTNSYPCGKRHDQNKPRKSVQNSPLKKIRNTSEKHMRCLSLNKGKKRLSQAEQTATNKLFSQNHVPIGSFVHVKIIDATSTYLVGKLI